MAAKITSYNYEGRTKNKNTLLVSFKEQFGLDCLTNIVYEK